MLGRRYGEESSYQLASNVMRSICDTAYSISVELAVEKGVFPAFDKAKFLQGQFVQQLSDELQGSIAKYGLRNSHLIAIAPTGTISLLAENVSSGLEPVYDFRYTRRVIQPDGQQLEFQVEDYAWRLWQTLYGDTPLAPYFLTARSLPPGVQVKMQAALQAHVDNAISKTINVPSDLKFAAFKSLYDEAYAMGLKGCTTFRPNPVSGAILSSHETTEYKLCSCEL